MKNQGVSKLGKEMQDFFEYLNFKLSESVTMLNYYRFFEIFIKYILYHPPTTSFSQKYTHMA